MCYGKIANDRSSTVSEHLIFTSQFPEGESEQTLPRDEDPAASCVPHCYTQDVSLTCCLSPGAYTIVPSTYQPDCSANFTLSLARRIHRLAPLFCLNLVIRAWLCSYSSSFKYYYYDIIVGHKDGCVSLSGKWWKARRVWVEPFKRWVNWSNLVGIQWNDTHTRWLKDAAFSTQKLQNKSTQPKGLL